jgi:CheY-like chemotaxis protein
MFFVKYTTNYSDGMLDFFSPLIYAVDDDEDDRYLLEHIFTDHFKECNLRVFDNGAALLTHLTHQLDGRLPDMIILDLEMPVFSGFELLHFLKQNDDFSLIPVSILSATLHKEHIDRCFELGSSKCLSKSQSYIELVSSIQQLQQYWSEALFLKKRTRKQYPRLLEVIDLESLSLN